MAEADFQDEVRRLRDEVSELKATTRVTKHDVNNLQQGQLGLAQRLEKVADQFTRELKDTRDGLAQEIRSINDKIAAELKLLSLEINSINKTQAKGAGFYAGVVAVLTVGGTLLMGVAKLLFGGSH